MVFMNFIFKKGGGVCDVTGDYDGCGDDDDDDNGWRVLKLQKSIQSYDPSSQNATLNKNHNDQSYSSYYYFFFIYYYY